MDNQFLNFFRELYSNLRTKSPKLFIILQLFACSLILLGKLPMVLERWTNIHAGPHFINFCNDISKGMMWFLGGILLSADKKVIVSQTKEGTPVLVTDAVHFPFTAKEEKKKLEEMEPPPPIAPKVPEPPK